MLVIQENPPLSIQPAMCRAIKASGTLDMPTASAPPGLRPCGISAGVSKAGRAKGHVHAFGQGDSFALAAALTLAEGFVPRVGPIGKNPGGPKVSRRWPGERVDPEKIGVVGDHMSSLTFMCGRRAARGIRQDIVRPPVRP